MIYSVKGGRKSEREIGKERDWSGWRTVVARSSGFGGGVEWAGGRWRPDRWCWAIGRRRVEEEERKKRKIGWCDLGGGVTQSGWWDNTIWAGWSLAGQPLMLFLHALSSCSLSFSLSFSFSESWKSFEGKIDRPRMYWPLVIN